MLTHFEFELRDPSDYPEKKRRVFVSYRKNDETKCPLLNHLIQHILNKTDCAIWYDKHLTVGQEYEKEILSVIAQCDVVLLLLTPTVLDSYFIWQIEIKAAIEQRKGIIPILAGIDKSLICEIEKRIGKVHMLKWFSDFDTEYSKLNINEFEEKLKTALDYYILNATLVDRVKLFFNSNRNSLSQRYLSFDELYLMAYGFINELGNKNNIEAGIQLMETIISAYGKDLEFEELQKDATDHLIRFAYTHNMIDLFLKLADTYLSWFSDPFSNNNVFRNVYETGWFSERFSELPKWSHALRKAFVSNFNMLLPHTEQQNRDEESCVISMVLPSDADFEFCETVETVFLDSKKYVLVCTRENDSDHTEKLKHYYLMCNEKIVDVFSLVSERKYPYYFHCDSIFMSIDEDTKTISVLICEFESELGVLETDMKEYVYSDAQDDSMKRILIKYGKIGKCRFLPFREF